MSSHFSFGVLAPVRRQDLRSNAACSYDKQYRRKRYSHISFADDSRRRLRMRLDSFCDRTRFEVQRTPLLLRGYVEVFLEALVPVVPFLRVIPKRPSTEESFERSFSSVFTNIHIILLLRVHHISLLPKICLLPRKVEGLPITVLWLVKTAIGTRKGYIAKSINTNVELVIGALWLARSAEGVTAQEM